MAPTTRNSTKLSTLGIKLEWFHQRKDEQTVLLQRLVDHSVNSITFPTFIAMSQCDPRTVSRSAFRNTLRHSLGCKALGAQLWDVWVVLPHEMDGVAVRGTIQVLKLSDERWACLQARMRRLPQEEGVEFWYSLRDLDGGEDLFEDE